MKKEQVHEDVPVSVEEKPKIVTVKFERLQELDQIYGSLLKEEGFENTKLGYAFKRFIDKNKKFFLDYNEALQEARVDNALTDEKTKALLVDKENPRGFQYSKEDFKKLLKEEKAILEKFKDKDCEVEPFICKDIGDNSFNEEEKEVLTGLVI